MFSMSGTHAVRIGVLWGQFDTRLFELYKIYKKYQHFTHIVTILDNINSFSFQIL